MKRLVTVLLSLVALAVNAGNVQAEPTEAIDTGFCAVTTIHNYAENLVYSDCAVGYLGDTSGNEPEFLTMQWTDGTKVNIWFNEKSRVAIIDGQDGLVNKFDEEGACFLTIEENPKLFCYLTDEFVNQQY